MGIIELFSPNRETNFIVEVSLGMASGVVEGPINYCFVMPHDSLNKLKLKFSNKEIWFSCLFSRIWILANSIFGKRSG